MNQSLKFDIKGDHTIRWFRVFSNQILLRLNLNLLQSKLKAQLNRFSEKGTLKHSRSAVGSYKKIGLRFGGIGQTRYVLGAIGAKNRRAYPYFAREPIAPITHHNLCVECNRLDRRNKLFKKKSFFLSRLSSLLHSRHKLWCVIGLIKSYRAHGIPQLMCGTH